MSYGDWLDRRGVLAVKDGDWRDAGDVSIEDARDWLRIYESSNQVRGNPTRLAQDEDENITYMVKSNK